MSDGGGSNSYGEPTWGEKIVDAVKALKPRFVHTYIEDNYLADVPTRVSRSHDLSDLERRDIARGVAIGQLREKYGILARAVLVAKAARYRLGAGKEIR